MVKHARKGTDDAAMTDRELRKLSRKDLLELLIVQGRERDALQAQLEQAKAALAERQIRAEQAGSIAEAALQLNGVFEAAQAAAQQYLDSVRASGGDVAARTAAGPVAGSSAREADWASREAEARRNADRQIREAAMVAKKIEDDARCRAQEIEEEGRRKAQAYWDETVQRLEDYCQEHEALKGLLTPGGKP